MKTFRKTVLLLIVFLFIAYFSPFILADDDSSPIVIPKENSNVSSEDVKQNAQMETSQLDQSLVSASGFANYVGMAVDDFIVEFGEPEEVKELSEKTELWFYGKDQTNFIQLQVKDYLITEILVLGSKVDVAPFEMGMKRNEIYQKASFHPTFEVPFEGQTVQIKLNETELNNQPLVAFDNQTYAVLTIDSRTDQLLGIQYMTNKSLVKSDLYEKSTFSMVTEEEPVKVNLSAQEKLKTELTLQYINIMRAKFKLEPLEYSLVLSAFGNELYDYDNQLQTEQSNEPSSIPGTPKETSDDTLVIDEEADVQKIEGSSKEASEEQESEAGKALLEETTIEDFLNNQNVSLEQVRLMYQLIQTKPSHYTLSWFILAANRDILMDNEMQRIGIAYRGDEMLIILDNGSEIHL